MQGILDWLEEVRFATWWMVIVAACAPGVILVVAWADRRRRQKLVDKLGHYAIVHRLMATASPARRRIKRALLAIAVALIALAAARPQTPGSAVRRGHGLDLVIALDGSKSMLVEDVGGTRLARARAMVNALFAKLQGDRVGAVVFAGAAAHFPLTEDEEVARAFLNDIGPLDLPPGSDLAGALTLSTCILAPEDGGERGEWIDAWSGECAQVGGRGEGGAPLPGEPDDGVPSRRSSRTLDERGKVVLVISDGGAGIRRDPARVDLAPVEKVRSAVELGVTVLVLGVGTEAGGEVPEIDLDGQVIGKKRARDGRTVISKLDREGLGLLGEAAGGIEGHYFELGAGGDPDPGPIVAALARVKRGGIAERDERVMIEHYTGFLFAGFMLLLVEACIGTRRRVPHPEG